jgi:hypothetical protein
MPRYLCRNQLKATIFSSAYVILGILVLTVFCEMQSFAGTVTGVIYNDSNQNNTLDIKEQVLSDIVVSDGKNCVTTDKNGKFTIDGIDGDNIIYVSLPDGFWYQDGFYRKVSVPKDGNISMDWGLIKQEQKLPFYFAQFSDLHLFEENVWFAEQFVERINSMKPAVAFVVGTGDIILDALNVPDPKVIEQRYQRYIDLFSRLQIPLFSLPGNHEHVGWGKWGIHDSNSPLYGLGAYKKYLGPPWYSFNYAGYHLVMIDAHVQTPDNDWGYKDQVSDDVTAWLKNDLRHISSSKPIILFLHPYPDNSWEIASLLKSYNLKGSFFGHGHEFTKFVFAGSSFAYESPDLGSTWGANIHGYLLCKATDNGIEVFKDAITRQHDISLNGISEGKVSGNVNFTAEIFDPDDEITSAFAGIDNKTDNFSFIKNDQYKRFDVTIDTSKFIDGFHQLWVGCRDAKQAYAMLTPIRIENGNLNSPAKIDSNGKLSFIVSSVNAPHEVYFGEKKLASLPDNTPDGKEIIVDVPMNYLSDDMTFTIKSVPKKKSAETDKEILDDLNVEMLCLKYNRHDYMSDRLFQRVTIGGEKSPSSENFKVSLRENWIPDFSNDSAETTKMEMIELDNNSQVIKLKSIVGGKAWFDWFDSSTIYCDSKPLVTIYHKYYNVSYCWSVPSSKGLYFIVVRKNNLKSDYVQQIDKN